MKIQHDGRTYTRHNGLLRREGGLCEDDPILGVVQQPKLWPPMCTGGCGLTVQECVDPHHCSEEMGSYETFTPKDDSPEEHARVLANLAAEATAGKPQMVMTATLLEPLKDGMTPNVCEITRQEWNHLAGASSFVDDSFPLILSFESSNGHGHQVVADGELIGWLEYDSNGNSSSFNREYAHKDELMYKQEAIAILGAIDRTLCHESTMVSGNISFFMESLGFEECNIEPDFGEGE